MTQPRVFTPEEMEARADGIVNNPCACSVAVPNTCTWCAQTAAMLRQAAQVQRERDEQQAKVAELLTWLRAEAKFDPMAPERSFALTDALVQARRLGLDTEFSQ